MRSIFGHQIPKISIEECIMSILKYKGLNRGLSKWKINILKYLPFLSKWLKQISTSVYSLRFKIFSHVGLVYVTHFQVVLLLLWQLITIILINYNYISSFYFTSNQPTKISWLLWHCLVYVYQKWFLKKQLLKTLSIPKLTYTHKNKISKCFFFKAYLLS